MTGVTPRTPYPAAFELMDLDPETGETYGVASHLRPVGHEVGSNT